MVKFLAGVLVGLILAFGVVVGAVFVAPSYPADPTRVVGGATGIVRRSDAVLPSFPRVNKAGYDG